MKPHPGICKEYRKKVSGDSHTTLELWEAVLIISIEDHPFYGHAEYSWLVGHPHGYTWNGLSDIIADYVKAPTPTDRTWTSGRKTFDLKNNGFPEKPNKTHNVSVRWQIKTPKQKG